MRLRHKSILVAALISLLTAWLFWNRPRRADMAAYVPADSLAFLEVDDLSALAEGIQDTDAWKALSGPAGARLNLVRNRWLVRVARWTGFGPAEAVVLARSQFALTVLRLETSEASTTLQIKPVVALVIETHTTQFRMRSVVDQRTEALARAHGYSQLQHKTLDGVDFSEWSAPDGARRIVSAFVGTVAIVGNDESAVQACVAVRRDKVPNLSGNKLLDEMRRKVEASAAPLFGFASSSGLRSLLVAYARSFIRPSTNVTNIPQILANAAANLTQGIAWTARFVDGATEDRYFFSLAEGVTEQLRGSVVPERPAALRSLDLLPPETDSLTQYDFRDPEQAWADLNTAVSSHVDALSAALVGPSLGLLLEPYGILDASSFLRSTGSQITTVRLDENASRSVLIAETLDEATVRKLVEKRLGADFKTERIGDAELLVSSDPELGAAAFAGNRVLTGPPDDVRRCLLAKTQSKSIADADSFRRAQRLLNPSVRMSAVTFNDDERTARAFVLLFSPHKNAPLTNDVTGPKKTLPYAVRVTELGANGFEQTSRSSFGLIGTLLLAFTSEDSS